MCKPRREQLSKTTYQKRTWITRPLPGIDRVSSAWLIQRFIDTKAAFLFGNEPGSAGKPDHASIEKFTAQVPSSVYLSLALGSMAASLAFQAAKKQHESLFVGQWAAPFLILGIYNKLVKIDGSDGTSANANS
jgi:hypothetical protein